MSKLLFGLSFTYKIRLRASLGKFQAVVTATCPALQTHLGTNAPQWAVNHAGSLQRRLSSLCPLVPGYLWCPSVSVVAQGICVRLRPQGPHPFSQGPKLQPLVRLHPSPLVPPEQGQCHQKAHEVWGKRPDPVLCLDQYGCQNTILLSSWDGLGGHHAE